MDLKKSFPVGMVDVTILLKEIYDREGRTFTSAEIIEVHEYGSSVKALSENRIYEFEISENLVKELNLDDLKDKKSRCRLMKIPGGMDRSLPDKLKVVSIEIE